MAADGSFLPALARLHPAHGTPALAIAIQTAWACALALTGEYGRLLNYVVFADWIFFGLTVGSLMVFRRTHPLPARDPGAFVMPGYPILPIAFVLVAAAVVLSVVRDDPASASRGALLLAAGVPVYYWFTRARSRRPAQSRNFR
jgi:APA family basic amino acid/polyamine antiporter